MPDRFTISSSYFGTASFTDPSIWTDGIIPTASDNIFIRGLQRTVTGQYEFWPATRSTFIINNTVDLPTSGSLYTYTDRNQLVKLDYRGISGAVTLLDITIDKSASSPWGEGFYNNYPSQPFGGTSPSFPNKKGGSIINGSIIQFKPGNIVLSGSATASILRTNIEFGGCLELRDSSTYYLGNYIVPNGGTFGAYDSSSIIWNLPWPSSSNVGTTPNGLAYPFFSASYVSVVNTPFTQLIFQGEEVRTNTTLSLDVIEGDSYLSVISAFGFEIGDRISVMEEDIQTSREDNNLRSIYGETVSSYDENFNVVGKDTGSIPNKLYIQRINGLEGKILATASSTELIVDEDRYQVGDKIIVNNQTRTIVQADDYDFLLKDYDFTDPSASLSEWEVDPTRGPSFQNWNIARGKGLTLQASEALNSFRQTYIKNLLLDRVKIEAWVSNTTPISGGLSSPAFRDLQPYAVVAHADPFMDNDYATLVVGTSPNFYASRSFMGINPNTVSSFMATKYTISTVPFAKPYIIGIKNIEDEHKLTFEHYKGFSKGYIDDQLVLEEISREKQWGRVGINTTNFKFLCSRFKVYNKCQKITLDSGVTVSINDKVYETGAEYNHKSGDNVIKLASIITDVLDLKNKAFAYQGTEEYENNGVFPYIYSIGRNDNIRTNADPLWTALGYPLADNVNPSQNGYALPMSTTGSFVFDLTTPISFDYWGFTDHFAFNGVQYTSSISGGISLSGSNDTFNWTPITGGADFRTSFTQGHLRDWNLPATQSFRYLRFQIVPPSTNLTSTAYTNILGRVRSFVIRSGSLNTFVVNNSSDLNIGDHIAIYSTNSPGNLSANRTVKYIYTVNKSSSIDFDNDYFVITGKSGNLLTVDKKINFTVNKGSFVVKLNRNTQIYGNYASGSLKVGRFFNGSIGNTFQSFLLWKNTSIRDTVDGFPNYSSILENSSYGDIAFGYFNPWIPWRIQGCSFYDVGNNSGATWGWGTARATTKAHIHIRGNVFHFRQIQGVGQVGGVNLPYIITSNFFIYSGNGNGPYNFNSLLINSYNTSIGVSTYQSQYNPLGQPFNNVGTFFMGARMIISRNYVNTGITIGSFYSSNDSTYTGNTSTYSDFFIHLTAKGNLLISGLGITTNAASYLYPQSPVFPIENLMLPSRGGNDGNYSSVRNTSGPFHFQASSPPGNISGYFKNYNKWGYDVYTNNKGWIIKEPNNNWYKFYHFLNNSITSVTAPRELFISSHIQVTDNSTSSFTIGFDYYNDNSQIIQDRSLLVNNPENSFIYYDYTPVIGGLAPWNYTQSISFVPSSASYAGSLVVWFYKNGNIVQNPILLPKRGEPTKFEYTFNLEGSGNYQIGLAQDTSPQGYLAMKNIWSRLIAPQTSNVFVKQNTFTMAVFDGLNAQQFRNTNNQYPQTNPKFRLKGAKLF